MSSRDRAWRRAQAERRKAAVRKYLVVPDTHRDDPQWIGRMASTPKPCSCPKCGNPRRFGGNRYSGHPLTMQERRAEA